MFVFKSMRLHTPHKKTNDLCVLKLKKKSIFGQYVRIYTYTDEKLEIEQHACKKGR